jgi:NADH-quinone oxidoreductase subunit G
VWMYGGEIYRVTARKDKYGEVHDFICNTCRFEKKGANDWTVERARDIERNSVISQGHYDESTMTVR